MRAVVVGAGKVGFELATRMAEEGHDVILVDRDEEALREVDEHLDVQILAGDGSSPGALEEASVGDSDLFVAVTDVDEVNMICCMIAKKMGARHTVARLREAGFEGLERGLLSSRQLGIDLVVRPEQAVAYEVVKLLRASSATDVEYFADGKVQMLGFKVQEGSPLANRTIEQADLFSCTVGAIVRDGDALVPHGNTCICPGDAVFIIGKTGVPSEVGWLVGAPEQAIRNVAIVGGGTTGLLLAQFLEKHWRHGPHPKLIERDRRVCERLSGALSRTLVINGDATKPDIFREENIHTADAFVALAGQDQVNLLAGFIAKNAGIPRVIARLRREDYVPVAERMGIEASVVPRTILAAAILRSVRRTSIKSLSFLRPGNLEAMEMVVRATCKACKKPLRSLGLPRGSIVGAVIRGDRVIVPRGDTVLIEGDHVVVFAIPSVIQLLDEFFRD